MSLSSISRNQIDMFMANMNTFLEETVEIINLTFEEYPSIQKKHNLLIDAQLITTVIGILNMCDIDYKQKIIQDFIEKSYLFWDEIFREDKDFLIHHVTSIFPNNNYVKDVSFFFGNNPDEKIYIDEETIEYLWEILKGMVTLSIKFIHYSGYNVAGKIDVDGEILKWNIKV